MLLILELWSQWFLLFDLEINVLSSLRLKSPHSNVFIFSSTESETGPPPWGAGAVNKESGLLAKTHHSHGVCNRWGQNGLHPSRKPVRTSLLHQKELNNSVRTFESPVAEGCKRKNQVQKIKVVEWRVENLPISVTNRDNVVFWINTD